VSEPLGGLQNFLIDPLCVDAEAEVVGVQMTVTEEGGQVRNEIPGVDHADVGVGACVFADLSVKLGETELHTPRAIPISAPYGGDHKNIRRRIPCGKNFEHIRALLVKARAPMAPIVRSVRHGNDIGIFDGLQRRKTCGKMISADSAIVKIGIQENRQTFRISKRRMRSERAVCDRIPKGKQAVFAVMRHKRSAVVQAKRPNCHALAPWRIDLHKMLPLGKRNAKLLDLLVFSSEVRDQNTVLANIKAAAAKLTIAVSLLCLKQRKPCTSINTPSRISA